MRRSFSIQSLLVLAVLVAACAGVPAKRAGVPLTGEWGGPHVALQLTARGGTLDYDCAAGTIDAPLIPDRFGRFAAPGTHSPGHGGPARIDEVPVRIAANYTGMVEGRAMTLSARLADGTTIGPLRLVEGAVPMLTRCL